MCAYFIFWHVPGTLLAVSNPVFRNVLYHIFVLSFEIYEQGDPENFQGLLCRFCGCNI